MKNQINYIIYYILNLTRIYGYKASKFHELCADKGPTVFFIMSEFKEVFGGYSSLQNIYKYYKLIFKESFKNLKYFISLPLKSPETGKWHFSDAFVFSLSKRSIHQQYRNQEYAVKHDQNYMCAFGKGGDIGIVDNSDQNSNNFCNLGGTYELPVGILYDTNESKSYLSGQNSFKVIEIEVYSVI